MVFVKLWQWAIGDSIESAPGKVLLCLLFALVIFVFI